MYIIVDNGHQALCFKVQRIFKPTTPTHKFLVPETGYCVIGSDTDFYWYLQPVRNRTCSILLPAAFTKHRAVIGPLVPRVSGVCFLLHYTFYKCFKNNDDGDNVCIYIARNK